MPIRVSQKEWEIAAAQAGLDPATGEKLPEPVSDEQAARDKAFMAKAAKPPEPPPEPPPPPPEEPAKAAKGAASGAFAGAKFGPVGVVAGAAAGYLLSQARRPQVIGTLEGPQSVRQEPDQSLLRELVDIQRTISRVGTPVKGAVKTHAQDSRL